MLLAKKVLSLIVSYFKIELELELESVSDYKIVTKAVDLNFIFLK